MKTLSIPIYTHIFAKNERKRKLNQTIWFIITDKGATKVTGNPLVPKACLQQHRQRCKTHNHRWNDSHSQHQEYS